MHYGELYINVKRIGLALDDLIRREYPGDWLSFIEVYTFAKLLKAGEFASLTAKKVMLFEPVVRLKADTNDKRVIRSQIPQQFTNIQHGLKLARKLLAHQDTPKRQIILITDGLPTAHFEGNVPFPALSARRADQRGHAPQKAKSAVAKGSRSTRSCCRPVGNRVRTRSSRRSCPNRPMAASSSPPTATTMDCSEVCENFNRWREL